MVNYMRVIDEGHDPLVSRIVGYGACEEADLEAIMAQPGGRLIALVDGTRYYLLNDEPVARERLIPETLQLDPGEVFSVEFPAGTRVTIRDADANAYLASEVAEDGRFDFSSDLPMRVVVIAILPPEAFRLLQHQSVSIEVR